MNYMFLSRVKRSLLACVGAAFVLTSLPLLAEPEPNWIWIGEAARENQRAFFRKEFHLDAAPENATLTFACDNSAKVWINGEEAGANRDWQVPKKVDVKEKLRHGKNVLAVAAQNEGGAAGLLVLLEIGYENGREQFVVTDKSWQSREKPDSNWQTNDYDASGWATAVVLKEYGAEPWGDVLAMARREGEEPEPVDRGVSVPEGFQAERLYTVPKDAYGSWVAITFDDQGRLIASPQDGKLCRVNIPPVGSDEPVTVEEIDLPIGSAQGLCYAYDSLYVVASGGPGSGLYRVQDTDQDGELDQVEKLQSLQGGGEHGPHGIIKDPEGKGLYLVCGNHTDPLDEYDVYLQPKVWQEDLLLPRMWDARGHARGRMAPGGWIAHVDPEGEHWTFYSNGFRNSYDIAFNQQGEMFTYDSDMEWDMGTPWYRPTRIYHVTSGSEFGWRSGTGKWPSYFPDALPPVLDVGPGSPTGVIFGTGLKYPTRYQNALFALDWTFGTIYSVHLTPNGSSYDAQKEEFITGQPLPVTDIEVGPDGALYFTVGGRGTQSALFRVIYTGEESTAAPRIGDGPDQEAVELRKLRRKLEGFHGREDPEAVSSCWPYLSHEDRFVRYAARIAIENQPLSQWREKVFRVEEPWAVINAVIALARHGDSSLAPKLIETLNQLPLDSVNEPQKLGLLRAYALTFVRMGKPESEIVQSLMERLDSHYPSSSPMVNRELCRLLVYLDSPKVIAKTLELMETEEPGGHEFDRELITRNPGYGETIANYLNQQTAQQEQQVFYALMLRNVEYGWTLEQRERYFQWFNMAREQYAGGASFQGFLENIKKEALEHTTEAEQQALASVLGEETESQIFVVEDRPLPQGPGEEWTMEKLLPELQGALQGRDFQNGKDMYAAAYCVDCHRFRGRGGAVGPDLTSVASRFSQADLLRSILEPNEIISDQYESTIIRKTDGGSVSGRIVSQNEEQIEVVINPLAPNQRMTIERDQIRSLTPSEVSIMPSGLIDGMNREEVLDLLAFLMSRGNPNASMFTTGSSSP